MEVFSIKNGNVESIEPTPFKLEREIQNVIEKNTQSFFGLEFVRSEFPIGNYRIDTLCFDNESNSFVIIEYKKGDSYSVIDQGYTYLQLLLNHKSDFLLVLSQYFNKVMRFEEVDWSQSRILFVSPSFNSYQKDSVNFKDLPFELWEIKNYSNNSVILNQHHSNSKESIETLSNPSTQNIISTVNKEITPSKTEEFHLSKSSPELVNKWKEMSEKINELEGVEIVPKHPYISVMVNGKTLVYFWFRKTTIRVEILRGNLNPDGSKSKGSVVDHIAKFSFLANAEIRLET